MITRQVGATAANKKRGMTFAELAAFVAEAQETNVAGDARVHVRVNVRGGIKMVETKP